MIELLCFLHFYWFFVLPFANCWRVVIEPVDDSDADYVAACYIAEGDQLLGRVQ